MALNLDSKIGLVGRERELKLIDEILVQRQPMLVVVIGKAGTGKTLLLQNLSTRIKDWDKTLGPDGLPPSITPDTTEVTFCGQIAALLKISADDSFSDPAPNPGKDAGLGSTVQSDRGGEQSSSPVVASHTRDKPTRSSRNGQLHPLVEQLRRLAPVLLLIDGYQPNTEFAHWFVQCFVADVQRSNAAIVIVVAERPQFATKLSPYADELITIGALDTRAVRRHLRAIGQQLVPPMEAAELTTYVHAARADPEILSSLTRILSLGRSIAH